MASDGTVHDEDVAAAFDEMGDLLAIQGENPFRIRAYRRAAQVVRGLPHELAEMPGADAYDQLPGIGVDLAGKIRELLRTGNLRSLQSMRRQVPGGLRELLELPGLGPIRVRALREGLGVKGREDLRRALVGGRLTKLRGFGPGLQRRLRTALADTSAAAAPRRLLLSTAAQYGGPLKAFLAAVPGVLRVEIAGSYRRGRETVGDLDFLVSARRDSTPFSALKGYRDLRGLTSEGTTKASGLSASGIRVSSTSSRCCRPHTSGAAPSRSTANRRGSISMTCTSRPPATAASP